MPAAQVKEAVRRLIGSGGMPAWPDGLHYPARPPESPSRSHGKPGLTQSQVTSAMGSIAAVHSLNYMLLPSGPTAPVVCVCVPVTSGGVPQSKVVGIKLQVVVTWRRLY
jgi:hypothetical protein